MGFKCNKPFDKESTFQFECEEDFQCPNNFKCCRQNCFIHKICTSLDETYSSEKGYCGLWPYECSVPYNYYTTYRFKCNNDNQCPTKYKCCYHNCFLHKVCLPTNSRVPQRPSNSIYTVKPNDKHLKGILAANRRVEQRPSNSIFAFKPDDQNLQGIGQVPGSLSRNSINLAKQTTITTTSSITTEEPTEDTSFDEYEQYYYHYGGKNDSDTDYDYDDEEED